MRTNCFIMWMMNFKIKVNFNVRTKKEKLIVLLVFKSIQVLIWKFYFCYPTYLVVYLNSYLMFIWINISALKIFSFPFWVIVFLLQPNKGFRTILSLISTMINIKIHWKSIMVVKSFNTILLVCGESKKNKDVNHLNNINSKML